MSITQLPNAYYQATVQFNDEEPEHYQFWTFDEANEAINAVSVYNAMSFAGNRALCTNEERKSAAALISKLPNENSRARAHWLMSWTDEARVRPQGDRPDAG